MPLAKDERSEDQTEQQHKRSIKIDPQKSHQWKQPQSALPAVQPTDQDQKGQPKERKNEDLRPGGPVVAAHRSSHQQDQTG